MTESRGARRRLGMSRLAVATLLAVAAVALVACKPRQETLPSGFCGATPTKKTGVSSPVAAPASGGLRVVETGFTPIGSSPNIPDGVTIGAVVENTSTLVAYRTQVIVRVLDPAGESAVDPRFSQLLHQEIPVILPGQRIGVGAHAGLRKLSDIGVKHDTVSTVDVMLTGEQWWPRNNDVHQFAEVTGAIASAHMDPLTTDGGVDVTVDSGYCRPVPARGIGVVLRNGNGAIIGGHLENDGPDELCARGKIERFVNLLNSVPNGVDPTKTTAYPLCDPSPRGPYPTGSDQPWN